MSRQRNQILTRPIDLYFLRVNVICFFRIRSCPPDQALSLDSSIARTATDCFFVRRFRVNPSLSETFGIERRRCFLLSRSNERERKRKKKNTRNRWASIFRNIGETSFSTTIVLRFRSNFDYSLGRFENLV